MDAYGGKIDEITVLVRDKEFLMAKLANVEKQLADLHVNRHSDAGRHADAVRKLNSAAKAAAAAAAKAAADAAKAAAAAAKAAADKELTWIAEMQRLKDEKNKYFHAAYWLEMACKAKEETVNGVYRELKSKDDIIYGFHIELKYRDDIIFGLHRELRYKDSIIKSKDDINTGLRREMATNDALTALTNGLKRP
jgi:hypothetical protein